MTQSNRDRGDDTVSSVLPQDHSLNGLSHAASRVLIDQGALGFAWLDQNLIVTARTGAIAAWIKLDTYIEDAIPPLHCMVDEIRSLRERHGVSVYLPNVGLNFIDPGLPKLTMQVFWQNHDRCFFVALTRENAQSESELQLRREIQLRRYAERRELATARALKRANEELTRANADLAEFGYVISHDLKAPLRALRLTAELLERDLHDCVDNNARANLSRIRTLCRRMGAMMTGLLEYARIGRKKEAVCLVDTNTLLRDIIGTIGAPPGLSIDKTNSWPVFETLGEPLDVVLRNLIENAIKHHDTKNGTIRLSADDDGPVYRFTIADDGPGVDPAYHEAIFQPFRRVDDEAAAEGSGIGLALVKKTVELMGGSVHVRSQPEQARGTTFVVRWPKIIAEA